MGSYFSKLFEDWFKNLVEVRVLILGLDGAGKTTILYRLQLGEVIATTPTIGFNLETVQRGEVKFHLWDLGGQLALRSYWQLYFANASAIIFVVDSSDVDRMDLCRSELQGIVTHEALSRVPILVLANKQDLPNALSAADIAKCLGLTELKTHEWAIFSTCAISGTGLYDSFDWLKV